MSDPPITARGLCVRYGRTEVLRGVDLEVRTLAVAPLGAALGTLLPGPRNGAAVLGAWAVAGLLLAPPLLRRAARRASGARPAGRRVRAAH